MTKLPSSEWRQGQAYPTQVFKQLFGTADAKVCLAHSVHAAV